jgi:hypothetical protein
LAANSIFLIALKKAAYTPRLITTNHYRIVLIDICFIFFATITF